MIRVAIDPGHFGGTLSRLEDRHIVFEGNEPVKEGDLNLRVSLVLKQMLVQSNCEVLITRGSYENFDRSLNSSKQDFEDFKLVNWKERAFKINDFKPDISLAIHFNANCVSNPHETKFNGVMTFIYSKDDMLIKWAGIIARNLSEDFGLPFCKKSWFPEEVSKLWEDLGGGVNFRELFILKNIKTPIVLTEGPFMNNLEVYISLIKDDSLVRLYAKSLFKSIKELFPK